MIFIVSQKYHDIAKSRHIIVWAYVTIADKDKEAKKKVMNIKNAELGSNTLQLYLIAIKYFSAVIAKLLYLSDLNSMLQCIKY